MRSATPPTSWAPECIARQHAVRGFRQGRGLARFDQQQADRSATRARRSGQARAWRGPASALIRAKRGRECRSQESASAVRSSRRGSIRAAAFVVLPGVSFQVGVKIGITAIQGLAVVLLADRRFVPLHGNRKPTLAARSKRAVGAGGFSSSFSTRKESRSLKDSRSACAISDSVFGRMVPRM